MNCCAHALASKHIYKLMKCLKWPCCVFHLCVCVFIGDLPNEAHVQTHGGGTPSESPVTTEDRVSQHPHPHLSHLNSTPSEFGQRSSGPAPMTNLWHQDSWHTVRSNQYTFLLRCNLHLKGSLCVLVKIIKQGAEAVQLPHSNVTS